MTVKVAVFYYDATGTMHALARAVAGGNPYGTSFISGPPETNLVPRHW